ncbi:hypothetical protein GCM10009760_02080 [Kitasatospora kazusensis]|uniref:Copper(I)-binding protein n=1 Tax=Kitasatospora kazusensis TaxID=407974 RepID=A0ABP5KG64_9ACTN
MERNAALPRTALPRTARVVAVPALALLALLTGCSSTAAPAPTGSPGATAPGSLSVQGPRSHLELTGGRLTTGASGASELAVSVRNAGTAPEHLAMVSTPDGGRATLQGGKGPDNALTAAGVLIRPGETAVFGGADGPKILFPAHPAGSAATPPSGPADAIMIFSVSGLVHFQVPAGR